MIFDLSKDHKHSFHNFYTFLASCPNFSSTCAPACFLQTVDHRYCHIPLKSLRASLWVWSCRGTGFFNQPQRRSKLCVPAKEEAQGRGLRPNRFTNSPRSCLTCSNFNRLPGTCCFAAPCQHDSHQRSRHYHFGFLSDSEKIQFQQYSLGAVSLSQVPLWVCVEKCKRS